MAVNTEQMQNRLASEKQAQMASDPNARKTVVKVKKTAIPIWCATAVWVIAAIFFPMYRVSHIVVIALISLVVGLIAEAVAPKQKIVNHLPYVSGNDELDTVIGTVDSALDSIANVSSSIRADRPTVSEQLSRISNTVYEIRTAIIAKPERVKALRRFLNYYLPTTVKLSTKYAESVKSTTDAAVTTQTAIREALDSIEEAFIRQRDAILADDVLDVTTDIQVLDTMLTRDNLA